MHYSEWRWGENGGGVVETMNETFMEAPQKNEKKIFPDKNWAQS